ncbi:MAG: hypothetical protein LC624_09175 [Halobacteriales archaeon]|nr:hypothetical protein [Halobacteriales archaeon]
MQELVQARRVCAVCRGEKPVSGVWYLLPPARGASRFVCESCFAPNAVA